MALGYIVNAAAFSAIVFGISPYFSDESGSSLITCYDDIIHACSHRENPYCAFDRLETCDGQQTTEIQISGRLLDNVRARQQRAADLIGKNHMTVSVDQRSVRLIPLDEIWRSQGS